MKQKTNCPNCGAPYDYGINKCPYCGTIYFDLSVIDFDSKTPIFLTIKKDSYLITQKAIPVCGDMEVISDNIYAYGGGGNKAISFTRSMSLTTNITFKSVTDEKNILLTATTINDAE